LIANEVILGESMFESLMAALIIVYFVPSADAWDRDHPKARTISLFNLLFGWTVVGWIAALAWARTDSPVEFYVAQNNKLLANRARESGLRTSLGSWILGSAL
jgi:type VI protein secretion system component VasK